MGDWNEDQKRVSAKEIDLPKKPGRSASLGETIEGPAGKGRAKSGVKIGGSPGGMGMPDGKGKKGKKGY